MLLKLKISSIALLAITFLFLINSLLEKTSTVSLHVEPTEQYQLKRSHPIEKFGNQTIYLEGKMEVKDFNFWQRSLVAQGGNPDIIQYFFLIVYLSVIILTVFRFDEKRFFAKDLSNKITLLANSIFVYLWIDLFRYDYLNGLVKELTGNNFVLSSQNRNFIALILSVALLQIIAKLFKRAHHLQIENDLTV